jgi:hypothetical protein
MAPSLTITTVMFASTMPQPRTDDRDELLHVTSAPMDVILAQKIASWFDCTQDYIKAGVGLFLQGPFSFESLHRLSIIVLLFERILRPLEDAAFTTSAALLHAGLQQEMTPTIKESSSSSSAHADQLGLLMTISFAFLLTRSGSVHAPLTFTSVNQEVVIIMTILFSVICLESFLPLAVWGLVSLVVFQSICWETTMSVLVYVWVGSVISSSIGLVQV